MALIATPVNPDHRPLPPGWSECYDKQKDRWYYIQDNIVPVRVSTSHPCNENSGSFTVERTSTKRSSISSGTTPVTPVHDPRQTPPVDRTSTADSIPSGATPVTPVHDQRQTSPVERTSTTSPSISNRTSVVSPVNDERQAPSSPPSTGLTLAQRLYASALPAKYTSNSPAPAPATPGSPESPRSNNDNSPTMPSSVTPTVVSMASVSAEAYGRRTSTNMGDSNLSAGSFYKSSVVHQLPQNRPPGGRLASSPYIGSNIPSSSSNLLYGAGAAHGSPHRTQSLQATRPGASSSGASSHPHRVSSYTAGMNSFTRPYEFSRPTETPHITLVARPPSASNASGTSHHQQASDTLTNTGVSTPLMHTAAAAPLSPGSPPRPVIGGTLHHQRASNTLANTSVSTPSMHAAAAPHLLASPPRPNASSQPQSPPPTHSPASPTNVSFGHPGAGIVHTSPPSSPPVQTNYTTLQTSTSNPVTHHASNPTFTNSMLPSVSSTPNMNAAPHRPPLQQGASQQATMAAGAGSVLSQAAPLQSNGAMSSTAGRVLSHLGRAAGRAALRYVGRVVIGSVLGQNPNLLSGLASGLFDNNLLSTLNNSLANFDVNSAGIDLTQFQAAFQGVPGTDYQGIINLMGQQQQTAPSPGVDYHAVISALVKIQHALQAQSQGQHQAGSTAMSHQAGTNGQVMQIAQHLLTSHQTGAAVTHHAGNASISPQLQHQQQLHQPMQQTQLHQQQQQHMQSHQQSYPQQPAVNLQQHQQTHVQSSQQPQPVLQQQAHVQIPHQNVQQPASHSQLLYQQSASYPQQTHVQPHLQSNFQQPVSHAQQPHLQPQVQNSPVPSQQTHVQPHPQSHSQQPMSHIQQPQLQPQVQHSPVPSQQAATYPQQSYQQSHVQSNSQQPVPHPQQAAPHIQQTHQSVPSQSPQYHAPGPITGGSPHSSSSPAHQSPAPPQYSEMGGTAGAAAAHPHPASAGSSSMSSAITSLSHQLMNMMHEHHGSSGEQTNDGTSPQDASADAPPADGYYGGDNEQPPEFSAIDYNNPPVFDQSTGMNLVVDPNGMVIATAPNDFVDGPGVMGGAPFDVGSGGDMFTQTADVTSFTDASGFMTGTTVDTTTTFIDGLGGAFSESVDTTSFFSGDGGFFESTTDQYTFTT